VEKSARCFYQRPVQNATELPPAQQLPFDVLTRKYYCLAWEPRSWAYLRGKLGTFDPKPFAKEKKLKESFCGVALGLH